MKNIVDSTIVLCVAYNINKYIQKTKINHNIVLLITIAQKYGYKTHYFSLKNKPLDLS